MHITQMSISKMSPFEAMLRTRELDQDIMFVSEGQSNAKYDIEDNLKQILLP